MMQFNREGRRYYVVIVATLLAGCCGSSGPPVVHIEEDDPVMGAAIEKARATVDEFVAALQSPPPGRDAFSVKIPVSDGDYVEHIWLSDVTYEDGEFTGKIGNDPESVTSISFGDEVSYSQSEISDWMYLAGNRLVGGYTIRALREKTPADQRDEFDASLPFTFD